LADTLLLRGAGLATFTPWQANDPPLQLSLSATCCGPAIRQQTPCAGVARSDFASTTPSRLSTEMPFVRHMRHRAAQVFRCAHAQLAVCRVRRAARLQAVPLLEWLAGPLQLQSLCAISAKPGAITDATMYLNERAPSSLRVPRSHAAVSYTSHYLTSVLYSYILPGCTRVSKVTTQLISFPEARLAKLMFGLSLPRLNVWSHQC
jgi:hypothetical protein